MEQIKMCYSKAQTKSCYSKAQTVSCYSKAQTVSCLSYWRRTLGLKMFTKNGN